MAFRANEEKQKGYEIAASYLAPTTFDSQKSRNIRDWFDDQTVKYGPVVERYPSWHPFVCNHDGRYPHGTPSEELGYVGLDHNVYLANAVITCPYHGSNADKILDSVSKIKLLPHVANKASINAERVGFEMYNTGTDPVIITCDWDRPLNLDRTIPRETAIGMMLEHEIPSWRWSSYGETWETMRPYFLGAPSGKRSSLFVNQETGQHMKKIWQAIIYSGVFGPLKV